MIMPKPEKSSMADLVRKISNRNRRSFEIKMPMGSKIVVGVSFKGCVAQLESMSKVEVTKLR